jgi:hypothetical protein
MQLTFSRALRIYPTDNCNIPFPNRIFSNSAYSVGSNSIFDPGLNFIELGIQIGDTIFNADYNTYSIITSVEENYLYFADNIFFGSGETYDIYQGVNQGCYVIPTADNSGVLNLSVITVGGDNVMFFGLTPGIPLPVKILRVDTNSSVGDIIAFW